MFKNRRLARRTLFGALGGLFLAPRPAQSQGEMKATFKLTVKDGGTQLNDPMQYLELHLDRDPSKIVIMGPPNSPFLQYLQNAQRLGYQVTFVASTAFPS